VQTNPGAFIFPPARALPPEIVELETLIPRKNVFDFDQGMELSAFETVFEFQQLVELGECLSLIDLVALEHLFELPGLHNLSFAVHTLPWPGHRDFDRGPLVVTQPDGISMAHHQLGGIKLLEETRLHPGPIGLPSTLTDFNVVTWRVRFQSETWTQVSGGY
jgi:hypothetical protein